MPTHATLEDSSAARQRSASGRPGPHPAGSRRVRLCLAVALIVLAGPPGASAAAAAPSQAAPPLPNSIASTGDSITRGFDIDAFHLLRDSPEFSWTTGADPHVDSQYHRLLALHPAIAGHAHNDARTGATMAALDGQLAQAASQHADYVTVLMGANDLCTHTAAQMTPTDTFRAQFSHAMKRFSQADPHALVFVSSIPNLRQLWTVLHTNTAARATWRLFGICQSMLAEHNTDRDRAAVDAREQADNTVLAEVCASVANCRFDNLATYHLRFAKQDVSSGDFFHPSKRGQRTLAATTWQAGFFRF